MTAPVTNTPLPTVEELFKQHLDVMYKYANELSNVLGQDSPIVTRIRNCAASNIRVLEAINKRKGNVSSPNE